MLRVELVSFDELSKAEQNLQPNNGAGKEYANYIKLFDGHKPVLILSDAMEPEDATFTRDLRNVIYAIEQAYKIGIKDGKRLRS